MTSFESHKTLSILVTSILGTLAWVWTYYATYDTTNIGATLIKGFILMIYCLFLAIYRNHNIREWAILFLLITIECNFVNIFIYWFYPDLLLPKAHIIEGGIYYSITTMSPIWVISTPIAITTFKVPVWIARYLRKRHHSVSQENIS